MRTYVDVRMRGLHSLAATASQQLESRQTEEALKSFKELAVRMKPLRLTSGWLAWGTAVSLDLEGELVPAFESICEALEQDPLNPPAVHSFEVITGRIRLALVTASEGDASVPALYELLQRCGQNDVSTHLAMADHLATTGKLDRALALLEAVTVTTPASRDAWVARARVARQAGDELTAASCEARAMSMEFLEVPFSTRVPASRQME